MPAESTMPSSERFSEQTTEELQDLLLESLDFHEFLLQLTVFSASRLGSEEPMLCAISVERDGQPFTVASSSDKARRMDESQYQLDDGPCLRALREGHTVFVEDLTTQSQWRRYAAVAAAENIGSILAVPIDAGTEAGAALNCYAGSSGAFDSATIAAVEEYAKSLSRIMRLALKVHQSKVHPDGLGTSLRSRAAIDAAMGLIMMQTRSSRDEAASLLHGMAQSKNQRLREISVEILNGAEVPLLGSLPLHGQGDGVRGWPGKAGN